MQTGDSTLSLTDPKRTSVIIAHREKLKAAISTLVPVTGEESKKPYEWKWDDESLSARFKIAILRSAGGTITVITSLKGYRNVAMNSESSSSDEKLFRFTIIEKPYVENELCFGDFPAPINFLVETIDKEACTFQVYGLPYNEKTLEILAVGQQVYVYNPCVDWKEKGTSKEEMTNVCFIVDEGKEQHIFMGTKLVDMCRYCGEVNAKSRCSSCKVRYCNRGCQKADWKILKHKLVCQVKTADVDQATSELGAISIEVKNDYGKQVANSKLNESKRIFLILNFRRMYKLMFQRMNGDLGNRPLTFKPDGSDLVPEMENPAHPEPIFLKDMKCDNIYENKVIELTIIEEPLFGYSYVHFVVEDKNKDVTYLAVNEWEENAAMCQRFHVGTTLLVMHPFYKLGTADGLPLIRVDRLQTIQIWKIRMWVCSYCGKEQAKRKCRGCERMYCGEECESKDREILNHNLICEVGSVPFRLRVNQLNF